MKSTAATKSLAIRIIRERLLPNYLHRSCFLGVDTSSRQTGLVALVLKPSVTPSDSKTNAHELRVTAHIAEADVLDTPRNLKDTPDEAFFKRCELLERRLERMKRKGETESGVGAWHAMIEGKLVRVFGAGGVIGMQTSAETFAAARLIVRRVFDDVVPFTANPKTARAGLSLNHVGTKQTREEVKQKVMELVVRVFPTLLSREGAHVEAKHRPDLCDAAVLALHAIRHKMKIDLSADREFLEAVARNLGEDREEEQSADANGGTTKVKKKSKKKNDNAGPSKKVRETAIKRADVAVDAFWLSEFITVGDRTAMTDGEGATTLTVIDPPAPSPLVRRKRGKLEDATVSRTPIT